MTRLRWILAALILAGLVWFAVWFDANFTAEPVPKPAIDYSEQQEQTK